MVGGQSHLLCVRKHRDDAFEVSVGDGEFQRIERRDFHGQTGATRWSWLDNGNLVKATVDQVGSDLRVTIGGTEVTTRVQDARKALVAQLSGAGARSVAGPFRLRTQIPGRVVKVLVAVGDRVKEGQPLVVVEAMKMENEMRAPRDGVVAELSAVEGSTIEAGTSLLVLAATS
jgi:biotin carboxyl carrier protein